MLEIDVKVQTKAPAEQVFALLEDAPSWSRWAPFDEAVVEQGEGVGEVRRFRTGRITSRERVTVLEPPHRFGYELLSGLPVRDYRAEVTLVPASGGGTEIRWHSKFAAMVPGTAWMMRRRLSRFIAETANGLARAAE